MPDTIELPDTIGLPSTIGLQGQCLCGAVKIKAKKVKTHIGACHCGMCQKWGGPLISADCGTDVDFEGTENISIYNSSAWAERGFCKNCGSHLFYRIKETKQHMVPAGLFNNKQGFELDHQVFIDKKPDYYSFSNKTTDMTEAEIFAMYAPPK